MVQGKMLRQALLAGFAFSAPIAQALAADLPWTKAPPPILSPAPVYSWSDSIVAGLEGDVNYTGLRGSSTAGPFAGACLPRVQPLRRCLRSQSQPSAFAFEREYAT